MLTKHFLASAPLQSEYILGPEAPLETFLSRAAENKRRKKNQREDPLVVEWVESLIINRS